MILNLIVDHCANKILCEVSNAHAQTLQPQPHSVAW